LEEINLRLKEERLRENAHRQMLEQQLKEAVNSIKELEEECRRRSLINDDRDDFVVDRKGRPK
jgi:hypothetical protein